MDERRYYGLDEERTFLDSRDLGTTGGGSGRVLDTVLAVGGDRYITGHGARNYLDHEMFERAGVRVEYMNYLKIAYQQLHGEFTPYVSALDLVANEGFAGVRCITSGTTPWQDFLNERRDC